MILARVEGSVVATKKNAKMTGNKFLLVRPLVIDSPTAKEWKPGTSTLVVTDSLGAGEGEIVLIVQEAPRASPLTTRIRPWTPS